MTEESIFAHQTHLFMRAITLNREGEIFNEMAKDTALVQDVNAKTKVLAETLYGDEDEEGMEDMEDEYMEEEDPDPEIPDTDSGRITFLMRHYEQNLIFEMPGMMMGDAPLLPLAFQIENAILAKSLACEGAENIPIGALLSKDDIKKMVQSERERKQKKTRK